MPSATTNHMVSAGAIAAALNMIEILHGRDAGMTLIRVPDDQPHLKYRLIGAAIHNFYREQISEVPDDVLPTVAGVLTAAVLDQDPYT